MMAGGEQFAQSEIIDTFVVKRPSVSGLHDRRFRRSAIRGFSNSGIQQRPKPPQAISIPSPRTPSSAACAVSNTFFHVAISFNPRIARACRQSATGRSYFSHSCAARVTRAAFDGASVSRSRRTLSSSPVRACPPKEIAQSFSVNCCAPMPAAHHGASAPNRRRTVWM